MKSLHNEDQKTKKTKEDNSWKTDKRLGGNFTSNGKKESEVLHL